MKSHLGRIAVIAFFIDKVLTESLYDALGYIFFCIDKDQIETPYAVRYCYCIDEDRIKTPYACSQSLINLLLFPIIKMKKN